MADIVIQLLSDSVRLGTHAALFYSLHYGSLGMAARSSSQTCRLEITSRDLQ